MTRILSVAMLAVMLALTSLAAHAQAVPDDVLLQLQQQLRAQQGGTTTDQVAVPAPVPAQQAQPQALPQAGAAVEEAPESALEAEYARRVPIESGRPRQVGYQALRQSVGGGDDMAAAVDGSYRLGIGDEIVVTLRGQKNITYRAEIDRDGRVVLPELPPVTAAGRTFGEFRQDLMAQVSTAFLETEAFISVARVRQITVLVTGEVTRPGPVTVSSLASLVDALARAGGINKTGTLRRVQLVRNGDASRIDLYSVLLGIGEVPDISLQDGDRLIVPTIGNTVSVSGAVVRPGIYEILGDAVSAGEALRLAGGALTPRGNRYQKVSPSSNGRNAVTELPDNVSGTLRSGDVLLVKTQSTGVSGAINVLGHVTVPGIRSLAAVPTVGALLSDRSALAYEPYLPFIVIRTRDGVSMAPRYEAVDGTRIRFGVDDRPLSDQDTVIVLSMTDVRYLFSADVQQVLSGRGPLYGRAEDVRDNMVTDDGVSAKAVQALRVCNGLRTLASLVSRRAIGQPQTLIEDSNDLPDVQVCPRLYDDVPDLLPFVVEHLMTLQGAVRVPGAYPVVDGVLLADVIAAAGGTSADADPAAVEVTLANANGAVVRQMIPLRVALSDYRVAPNASVRVNSRFSDREDYPVYLSGEVRRPGTYTITRGERLSQVIERAGGYTDQAYPLGAVFTRMSIKGEEERSYRRMAAEVESSLPTALQEVAARDPAEQDALMKAMAQVLGNLKSAQATGRMVVEADPAVLQIQPEKDIILQPGDRLIVPKRPAHVMISGEVMHAGAQNFEPGLPVEEYIRRAGGLRDSADEDRIFVVLPNGEARPMDISFWNYKEVQLPPGSTIVVPRDLTPLSFWSLTRDVMDVAGNIAISAAALWSIAD